MDKPIPTVRVGGLNVAALGREETAELMLQLARERAGTGTPPAILTSANGQVLSAAARDAEFKAICEQAEVLSADGQPMVFASRLLANTPLPERVATTDLFHDVAKRAEREGLSFYLLGATREENASAVRRVRSLYPGLRIAGARHGYFDRSQEPSVADEIAKGRPDVLWVALGVPREQRFLIENRERLTGVGVAKTSGGLFNFLSGSRSRAPHWMQTAGLEWLYRACLEPRRLASRYAITNVHATYLLLRQTG